MSPALTVEAALYQRADDPGVRRDYHVGAADNIDDSSEKLSPSAGLARELHVEGRG
jgi:hypothetical protein